MSRAAQAASGSKPQPARASRTQRGEARRKEILEVARDVFARKGFERTSMAEIAAKVGVVEGALYKHFGGKRELLFESTRAFYEPLILATSKELVAVQGARNRLHFVIWKQLQAFATYPEICRLIMQDIRPYDDYHGSVIRELNKKATSAVVGILEDAKRSGELRGDVKSALVRDVIFGGIEHLAWRALSGRGVLDVPETADALTQLIWSGVQASAPHEPSSSERERELERLRVQVDRLHALVEKLSSTEPRP